jgi:HSP20 family molecular chaperone IbpA
MAFHPLAAIPFLALIHSLGPFTIHPLQLQAPPVAAAPMFAPQFKVKESTSGSYYLVQGNVRGFNQGNIKIDFEGETLRIQGDTQRMRTQTQNVGRDVRNRNPKDAAAEKGRSDKKVLAMSSKRGPRPQQVSQAPSSCRITEQSQQRFTCYFTFASAVEHENVLAELNNDVLKVLVRKKKESPRK